MNNQKPTKTRKSGELPEEVQALWDEIDATNWRKPPFYGMISKVARDIGITQQAGNNAVRRRNIHFGILLLAEKRKIERSVREVLRSYINHDNS